MTLLEETLNNILPLDDIAMRQARERQDQLTKPRGSLGRLETISVQIAGITGQSVPVIEQSTVVTMAADHGVVAEGVSLYPQEVTRQMVLNFLNGNAAVNIQVLNVGFILTKTIHHFLIERIENPRAEIFRREIAAEI